MYGTATEDMDALTFGTPRLIRHMMQSAQRKEPIVEYDLAVALSELKITMEQVSHMVCSTSVLVWFTNMTHRQAFAFAL